MTRMERSPWLVEMSTSPPARNEVFYAVPHAGAGAAAVRDLCRRIGRFALPVAVRLPAREARLHEKPLRDVQVIADQAAEAISAHARGRGITVYGHCSGAIVAFEIVRRLREADVRALFLSAHEPPDRIPRNGVWRYPLGPFMKRVAADGYVPDFVLQDDELLELLVPALRADYEAIESHRCAEGAVITPAIVGILGAADSAIDERDFGAWSGFTEGGFELHRLAGGHNLLLDHTDDVADVITSRSGWH
ncbi:thioesterase domain-containing protein [Streptomyces sp. ML-6]|uniref:thioesterase II family protein n=1 Tax=Streptomyces sp. ML-6 TaxID=2982693 RepID=UPI0024C07011|nr:thioesterase domain-containing protein [Streptomyces sp. ML-6]MDK0517982.1 thioesterase domain-containing protein [Streptomyces sp. ML-6]